MKFLLILTLLVVSWHSKADDNLLECGENNGFLLSKCTVQKKILRETPSYLGEKYESDFKVVYSFPCKGHQPEFGVISDKSFARFELDASRLTIEVRGREAPKTYDSKPSENSELSFDPSCRLVVHEVKSQPSNLALETWVREARAQSNLIDVSVLNYQSAADFEHYSTWDKTRTKQLHDSVAEKVLYFEKLCKDTGEENACKSKLHFSTVRNALKAKLDQQPTLTAASELSAEVDSVAKVMKARLLKEIGSGQKMVKKFKHFQREVEETLKEALDKIPEDIGL